MDPFRPFWAKKVIKIYRGNLPGPVLGAGPPLQRDASFSSPDFSRFFRISNGIWTDFVRIVHRLFGVFSWISAGVGGDF